MQTEVSEKKQKIRSIETKESRLLGAVKRFLSARTKDQKVRAISEMIEAVDDLERPVEVGQG